MFGVPKLMAVLPDFDPLLAILGLFGVVALCMHLGLISGDPPEQGDGFPRKKSTRQSRSSQSADEDAEPTTQQIYDEMLKEAERCLKQNSWSRVQELSRKMTDLDPQNARAWVLLATAQKWDGQRDEAAATVQKAMELYEVESPDLLRLKQELTGAQSGQQAVAECEAKGEGFISKRQYDLASECYTKALEALDSGETSAEQRPVQLRLLRRRAECAQQLQDWSTCRRDASALLEEDPYDACALLQRAASNEALEKFAAAADDARRLLSIDPKSAAANRIVHNCQQALRS